MLFFFLSKIIFMQNENKKFFFLEIIQKKYKINNLLIIKIRNFNIHFFNYLMFII
jgi:hypothetical protein